LLPQKVKPRKALRILDIAFFASIGRFQHRWLPGGVAWGNCLHRDKPGYGKLVSPCHKQHILNKIDHAGSIHPGFSNHGLSLLPVDYDTK
jgi:hypothetical protein